MPIAKWRSAFQIFADRFLNKPLAMMHTKLANIHFYYGNPVLSKTILDDLPTFNPNEFENFPNTQQLFEKIFKDQWEEGGFEKILMADDCAILNDFHTFFNLTNANTKESMGTTLFASCLSKQNTYNALIQFLRNHIEHSLVLFPPAVWENQPDVNEKTTVFFQILQINLAVGNNLLLETIFQYNALSPKVIETFFRSSGIGENFFYKMLSDVVCCKWLCKMMVHYPKLAEQIAGQMTNIVIAKSDISILHKLFSSTHGRLLLYVLLSVYEGAVYFISPNLLFDAYIGENKLRPIELCTNPLGNCILKKIASCYPLEFSNYPWEIYENKANALAAFIQNRLNMTSIHEIFMHVEIHHEYTWAIPDAMAIRSYVGNTPIEKLSSWIKLKVTEHDTSDQRIRQTLENLCRINATDLSLTEYVNTFDIQSFEAILQQQDVIKLIFKLPLFNNKTFFQNLFYNVAMREALAAYYPYYQEEKNYFSQMFDHLASSNIDTKEITDQLITIDLGMILWLESLSKNKVLLLPSQLFMTKDYIQDLSTCVIGKKILLLALRTYEFENDLIGLKQIGLDAFCELFLGNAKEKLDFMTALFNLIEAPEGIIILEILAKYNDQFKKIPIANLKAGKDCIKEVLDIHNKYVINAKYKNNIAKIAEQKRASMHKASTQKTVSSRQGNGNVFFQSQQNQNQLISKASQPTDPNFHTMINGKTEFMRLYENKNGKLGLVKFFETASPQEIKKAFPLSALKSAPSQASKDKVFDYLVRLNHIKIVSALGNCYRQDNEFNELLFSDLENAKPNIYHLMSSKQGCQWIAAEIYEQLQVERTERDIFLKEVCFILPRIILNEPTLSALHRLLSKSFGRLLLYILLKSNPDLLDEIDESILFNPYMGNIKPFYFLATPLGMSILKLFFHHHRPGEEFKSLPILKDSIVKFDQDYETLSFDKLFELDYIKDEDHLNNHTSLEKLKEGYKQITKFPVDINELITALEALTLSNKEKSFPSIYELEDYFQLYSESFFIQFNKVLDSSDHSTLLNKLFCTPMFNKLSFFANLLANRSLNGEWNANLNNPDKKLYTKIFEKISTALSSIDTQDESLKQKIVESLFMGELGLSLWLHNLEQSSSTLILSPKTLLTTHAILKINYFQILAYNAGGHSILYSLFKKMFEKADYSIFDIFGMRDLCASFQVQKNAFFYPMPTLSLLFAFVRTQMGLKILEVLQQHAPNNKFSILPIQRWLSEGEESDISLFYHSTQARYIKLANIHFYYLNSEMESIILNEQERFKQTVGSKIDVVQQFFDKILLDQWQDWEFEQFLQSDNFIICKYFHTPLKQCIPNGDKETLFSYCLKKLNTRAALVAFLRAHIEYSLELFPSTSWMNVIDGKPVFTSLLHLNHEIGQNQLLNTLFEYNSLSHEIQNLFFTQNRYGVSPMFSMMDNVHCFQWLCKMIIRYPDFALAIADRMTNIVINDKDLSLLHKMFSTSGGPIFLYILLSVSEGAGYRISFDLLFDAFIGEVKLKPIDMLVVDPLGICILQKIAACHPGKFENFPWDLEKESTDKLADLINKNLFFTKIDEVFTCPNIQAARQYKNATSFYSFINWIRIVSSKLDTSHQKTRQELENIFRSKPAFNNDLFPIQGIDIEQFNSVLKQSDNKVATLFDTPLFNGLSFFYNASTLPVMMTALSAHYPSKVFAFLFTQHNFTNLSKERIINQLIRHAFGIEIWCDSLAQDDLLLLQPPAFMHQNYIRILSAEVIGRRVMMHLFAKSGKEINQMDLRILCNPYQVEVNGKITWMTPLFNLIDDSVGIDILALLKKYHVRLAQLPIEKLRKGEDCITEIYDLHTQCIPMNEDAIALIISVANHKRIARMEASKPPIDNFLSTTPETFFRNQGSAIARGRGGMNRRARRK